MSYALIRKQRAGDADAYGSFFIAECMGKDFRCVDDAYKAACEILGSMPGYSCREPGYSYEVYVSDDLFFEILQVLPGVDYGHPMSA